MAVNAKYFDFILLVRTGTSISNKIYRHFLQKNKVTLPAPIVTVLLQRYENYHSDGKYYRFDPS